MRVTLPRSKDSVVWFRDRERDTGAEDLMNEVATTDCDLVYVAATLEGFARD